MDTASAARFTGSMVVTLRRIMLLTLRVESWKVVPLGFSIKDFLALEFF
jgi:hypothetical protein